MTSALWTFRDLFCFTLSYFLSTILLFSRRTGKTHRLKKKKIKTQNSSARRVNNMPPQQHLKCRADGRTSHEEMQQVAGILCIKMGVKIDSILECRPTWVVTTQVAWGCNVSLRSRWKAAADVIRSEGSDQVALSILFTVIRGADWSQMALDETPAVEVYSA